MRKLGYTRQRLPAVVKFAISLVIDERSRAQRRRRPSFTIGFDSAAGCIRYREMTTKTNPHRNKARLNRCISDHTMYLSSVGCSTRLATTVVLYCCVVLCCTVTRSSRLLLKTRHASYGVRHSSTDRREGGRGGVSGMQTYKRPIDVI
jgi:hypothetical protein